MIQYEIKFDFPEQEEGDLDKLNAQLSRMELSSLTLEDLSSYLATTRSREGALLSQTCGLNSGRLVGEAAQPGAGYRYSVGTSVYPMFTGMDHDRFWNEWQAMNPSYQMTWMQSSEYSNDSVRTFVYLYRTK